MSMRILRSSSFRSLLTAGLGTFLLLVWLLQIRWSELDVPYTYTGDALHMLMLIKSVHQGDWVWQNTRLAMPFIAEMRDYPIALVPDLLAMKALGYLVKTPGATANWFWMLSLVLSSLTATWALLRLKFGPILSASCGIIYALQPFGFVRGIHHLSLTFYLVPLLSVGAIELLSGRLVPETGRRPYSARGLPQWVRELVRTIPPYFMLAAAIQGVSHAYNSFFAAYLIAGAGFLSGFIRRRTGQWLIAASLVFMICLGLAVSVSPSLYFWHEHGRNPQLAYKTIADAEIYGLKIRHLLMPIDSHPLPFVRNFSQRMESAGFPLENENSTSRLGGAMSIAFLAVLLGGMVASMRPSNGDYVVLRASYVLLIACILLATIGGLGSIFNVFAARDVRAYNRIVVFIGFLSLAGFCDIVRPWIDKLRRAEVPVGLFVATAIVLTIASAGDSAPVGAYRDYEGRRRIFDLDAAFVRECEALVPSGSMVFQLPHTTFPVDNQPGRMAMYDQAVPYLHSRTLRWSWGAFTGREGEWHRYVSSLEPLAMLQTLADAGFAGLWIDEYGYSSATSPTKALSALVGKSPVLRRDGRMAFLPLLAYANRRHANLDPTGREHLRRAALHPVRMAFSGFYPEEVNEIRRWRWCPGDCGVTFVNETDFSRHIRVSMLLQTASAQPSAVRVRVGNVQQPQMVDNATRPYTRVLTVQPNSEVALSFSTSAPLVAPLPARPMRLAVVGFQVEEVSPDSVRAPLQLNGSK